MEPKDTKPTVFWVPIEIWRHIIFNLDLPSMSYSDFALTWINLRGVSSFFQAEIEALFQELVLPGTEIDVWLKPDLESKVRQDASSDFHAVFNDQLKVPKPSSSLQRRIRCTFFQVCKENGLATFHPDLKRPMKKKHAVVLDQAFQMLEELCRPHVEGPFAQHYMLQVSGVHNNLVIPEMRVRKREWEICFDWRKLFSKLFSEEMVALKLAKLSDEAIKELLQRERHCHCLPDDGDFQSHLRSERFRKWYNHQCTYIADKVPESDYFDPIKVAQRLLESGLREYHLRFDRESYKRPSVPWEFRRHGIVFPRDIDGESSEEDSSEYYESSDDYDYDPSVDGEHYGDDLAFLSMAGLPIEGGDDHQVLLPRGGEWTIRSALPKKNDSDAAAEANALEHSMPEKGSD